MKTLAFYLLQVVIASGILYSYYHFALRNKRFHRYNRFYLVASTIISLVIPFLNIPVYFSKQDTDTSFVVQTLTFISSPGLDQTTPSTGTGISVTTTNWFTWEHILLLIYLLTAFIFLLRIVFSLLRLKRMIRNNPMEELDSIRFVNTSEPGTPFSFFRWLFWNRNIELGSQKGKQVFRHELFHIQQKHSVDIMYLELLTVFCWINPFFHLIKKEVKAIHEFLADEFAITENNRWEYAELLLMQALNTPLSLVNPFFHNQIKRRIAMITSSKKPAYQYLRKIMMLPIAVIVIAIFAFQYRVAKTTNSIIIEGNVKGLPDGKVYLAEAHYWNVFLDSAIVSNGHFRFEIKTDDSFEPYMASINFPDGDSWSKLGQLKPSFYLEQGKIEITDDPTQKPYEVPSGASFIPIKIEAGKENELFSKYDIGGITPGQDPAFRPRQMEILKTEIRDYPSSYFLLHNIYADRGRYSKEELKTLLTLFNSDLQKSKTGILLQTYIANGPKPGEVTHLLIDTIPEVDIVKQKLSDPDLANSKNYFKGDIVFKEVKGGKVYWANATINGKIEAKDTTLPLEDMLIFIDGKERPDLKLLSDLEGKIDPSSIKLVNVLKEPLASEKYGKRGKKGVIEIYTNTKDALTYNPFPDTTKPMNKKSFLYSKPDNLILEADTVVSKSGGKPVVSFKKALWVVNGQKMGGDYADEHTILSDKVIFYPANNEEAIRLYGKDAENGVIVFIGARIINQPTQKYYESYLKSVNTSNTPPENRVFEKVEIEPAFPGGVTKWKQFVDANVKSTIPVQKGAPAGTYTVIVQFIVSTEGSISDLRTLTKHGYGMEEEALRVIKNGPKWLPAIQNGKKVNAYRKQPITFVITGDPGKVKTVPPVQKEKIEKVDVAINYDNKVFEKAEIAPAFPGGEEKWKQYIAAALDKSVPVKNNAPKGDYSVIVRFIVRKDGTLSDIKALTKFGYGMEEEAMRIIRQGPRWVPASQNGFIVSAYKVQSVNFFMKADSKTVTEVPALPVISLSELKNINPHKLLQLEEGTEIISFQFTTDLDDGTITEAFNNGNQFSEATKKLIEAEKPGRLITIDQIRARINGSEKKLPGKIYKVIS